MAFEMKIEKYWEQFLKEKEYMLDRSPKTMAYLRRGGRCTSSR